MGASGRCVCVHKRERSVLLRQAKQTLSVVVQTRFAELLSAESARGAAAPAGRRPRFGAGPGSLPPFLPTRMRCVHTALSICDRRC